MRPVSIEKFQDERMDRIAGIGFTQLKFIKSELKEQLWKNHLWGDLRQVIYEAIVVCYNNDLDEVI